MCIEFKTVRDISYNNIKEEIYEYVSKADHFVSISELAENLCIDISIVKKIHNNIYDFGE